MLKTAPPTGQEQDAPPLSWRAWLVLPLVLAGAIGVGVPAWRNDLRPPRAAPTPDPVARAYAGELLPHLRRNDLDGETLGLVDDLHRRLMAAQEQRGGITAKDSALLDSLLKRLGR